MISHGQFMPEPHIQKPIPTQGLALDWRMRLVSPQGGIAQPRPEPIHRYERLDTLNTLRVLQAPKPMERMEHSAIVQAFQDTVPPHFLEIYNLQILFPPRFLTPSGHLNEQGRGE